MNIQDIRERRILKITKGHTREYCQNIKIDAYIIYLVNFFYLFINVDVRANLCVLQLILRDLRLMTM
jgi:hypothetical protein